MRTRESHRCREEARSRVKLLLDGEGKDKPVTYDKKPAKEAENFHTDRSLDEEEDKHRSPDYHVVAGPICKHGANCRKELYQKINCARSLR